MTQTKLKSKLFLLLTSTLLTLSVAELFLRQFDPQITFADIVPYYDFRCFQKGDYYWIDLMPNRRCTLTPRLPAFPPHTVDLNSLGLRNPEITLPKPQNTNRILFIGDSFVFGLGVEEEQTFVRQTEVLLNQQLDHPLEAINAGLPAAGPSYYYMYLDQEGQKLEPDVVVVGFYLRNDVAENVLNSQWVEVNAQGLPTKTTSSIYYVDPTGNLFPAPLPFKYRVPILRSSHLFVLVADRLPPPPGHDPKKFISNQICFYKKSCSSLNEAKAKTKILFQGIKHLTDAQGQKLLVVFIPSELQFTNKVNFTKTEVPIPLSPQEKDYPHNEFAAFFTQEGIDYLDLREYFAAKDPLSAYFAQDRHWNESGHQLAAEALSQKLLDYLR